MPQYAQSQLDPFGGSPTGNNPYYWQAQQGQGTGQESAAFRANVFQSIKVPSSR